jgi:hypothetical protein
MHYSIDPQASPVARQAMEWVFLQAAGDRQIKRDRARLVRVLRMDKEELCVRLRS